MSNKPFQIDRPLFVKLPFFTRGKTWNREETFPWKEMNMDQKRVQTLYYNGYLIHNEEQEIVMQVGDGLELLELEGLHQIVNDYNDRVKAVAHTNTVFLRRKCALSKIADKQRGLIRSWRRNNLDWLVKTEENK